MADDDFDIDIYGDVDQETEPQPEQVQRQPEPVPANPQGSSITIKGLAAQQAIKQEENQVVKQEEDQVDYTEDINDEVHDAVPDVGDAQQPEDASLLDQPMTTVTETTPQPQGTKRKENSDDQCIDAGATTAILISELHWWNTEDDVRGWINKVGCESGVLDITFSEHKVNGKSKGQAFVEFGTQHAASTTKRAIETLSQEQTFAKKYTVVYSNPNVNPFKTISKDTPAKSGQPAANTRGGFEGRGAYNNNNNNYRGRGSYNQGRGNAFVPRGNFNNNNNNNNMNNMNSMNNMNRGGFQQPMGAFPNMRGGAFGGFNNGMMNGMRGGAMGMPMGGMGMPGMSMGMNPMGGVMPGVGFPGMAQNFNPAFFQQQQAQNQNNGMNWQNQNPSKRPRMD